MCQIKTFQFSFVVMCFFNDVYSFFVMISSTVLVCLLFSTFKFCSFELLPPVPISASLIVSLVVRSEALMGLFVSLVTGRRLKSTLTKLEHYHTMVPLLLDGKEQRPISWLRSRVRKALCVFFLAAPFFTHCFLSC